MSDFIVKSEGQGGASYTPLFTEDELRVLVTPAGDLACEAIDLDDLERARAICVEAKDMQRPLHDNYSIWHAQTLAYIVRQYGIESLHQALTSSIKPWFRPIAELFRNGVTREAVSSVAQIWRMYCLEFGPIEEDEGKISMFLSGYGDFFRADQSGAPVKQADYGQLSLNSLHVVGGQEPQLPLFSTAILHSERLATEWLGYPPFVTDFNADGTPEKVVIYKDPSQIPEHYFNRLNSARDARLIRGAVDVAGGHLFQPGELADLGRQYMERAVSAMDAGDKLGAKGWCQLSKGEWYPAHHIHRDWITGQLAYIYSNFGVDAVYDAMWKGYNEPFVEPIFEAVEQMSLREQVEGLALGFRQHAMRFSILEDAEKFVFKTEPCGSGGRLLQEKAYDEPKSFPRIKEKHKAGFYIEDFPVYCIHCPTTNEQALQRGGPYYLLVDGDLMNVPDGNCNFYIFKNPDAVPDRFYRRAGLDRSECGTCSSED
jgi:hypothetical protein